jgi:hypothetical protein
MVNWTGTASNESHTGTTATDTLIGHLGSDSLWGLGGNDVLHGDMAGGPMPPGTSEILVTPVSPLWQTGSSIAGQATGGFLVAYASGPVSSHPNLAAQRDDQIIGRLYDATGSATTAEFTINTTTAGQQNQPAVARLSDGNFIVVWTDESGTDGSGAGIFAQRVSPGGALISGQFQIN